MDTKKLGEGKMQQVSDVNIYKKNEPSIRKNSDVLIQILGEDGPDKWYINVTTTDGSEIKFDPLLLEDDHSGDERRLRGRDQDDVDGFSDDDVVDPYDELGRTPPRQVVARNRKWSSDKKFMRENEKR